MPSPIKLAANRANAAKSTGPRTTAGIEKTRYNATRHGLSGKQVVIQGEDPAAYEALLQGLKDSYCPANTAEAILVEEIAQTFWRLQRARALEAEAFLMLSGGADPIIPFNAESARFDNIRRYMTTIERAYHRAIAQLEKTQAIRAGNSVGFVSQIRPKVVPLAQKPAISLRNRSEAGPQTPDNRPSVSELSLLRQVPLPPH